MLDKQRSAVASLKLKQTLTRVELRDTAFKAVPSISRDQARKIVDELFEEIITTLLNDEIVKLRGFGNFVIQHKRPRPGRNPKTGKDAVITARKAVKFSPSPILNARVNGSANDSDHEQ